MLNFIYMKIIVQGIMAFSVYLPVDRQENPIISHEEAPHVMVGELPGGSMLYPVSHVYVAVHPYVVHA